MGSSCISGHVRRLELSCDENAMSVSYGRNQSESYCARIETDLSYVPEILQIRRHAARVHRADAFHPSRGREEPAALHCVRQNLSGQGQLILLGSPPTA